LPISICCNTAYIFRNLNHRPTFCRS